MLGKHAWRYGITIQLRLYFSFDTMTLILTLVFENGDGAKRWCLASRLKWGGVAAVYLSLTASHFTG